MSGHSNWVRAAAFNCTGDMILSGGDDKTVRLWDLSQRSCVHKFYDHTGYGMELPAMRTCSYWFRQASARRALSSRWSVCCGMQCRYHYQNLGPSNATVIPLCLLLFLVYNFHKYNGRLLQHYAAHEEGVNSIDIHPSGDFLISASSDMSTKV